MNACMHAHVYTCVNIMCMCVHARTLYMCMCAYVHAYVCMHLYMVCMCCSGFGFDFAINYLTTEYRKKNKIMMDCEHHIILYFYMDILQNKYL